MAAHSPEHCPVSSGLCVDFIAGDLQAPTEVKTTPGSMGGAQARRPTWIDRSCT